MRRNREYKTRRNVFVDAFCIVWQKKTSMNKENQVRKIFWYTIGDSRLDFWINYSASSRANP